MDYWGEMPFYQLDLWELKTAFAGVFTANRVTQAAFRTASVPAHILYDPLFPSLGWASPVKPVKCAYHGVASF